MTSQCTSQLTERLRSKLAMRQFRKRQAGMLPPLARCDCGRRIASTSRWKTLCSLCAKAKGLYRRDVAA